MNYYLKYYVNIYILFIYNINIVKIMYANIINTWVNRRRENKFKKETVILDNKK